MKKKIKSDLVVYGGKPLFSKPVIVGRPNIGDMNKLNTYFSFFYF